MLKFNKKLCGMLIFILVFFTSTAFGQKMPHGKWWHSPKASEKLNLSSEETNQLDEKFLESRRNLIDLKAAVEKERLELDALMDKEPLNESSVMIRFKKLETARANLAAERFKFILEVRKIIGFERFQQLKTSFKGFRQERRQKDRGERGHQRNDEYGKYKKMPGEGMM
ncbi:Spy/CpxP family protein refolding chaperone [Thermodesulfobacteriota bacterium]